MKYFSKVTSRGYTAKNKLEEAAKQLCNTRDQVLIDELDSPQWIDDLKDRIEALNKYFSRCKPLRYSCVFGYNSEDRIFNCEGVFIITLYKVKSIYNDTQN